VSANLWCDWRRLLGGHLESLFRFVSYQSPRCSNIPLGAPDVHWISLNPRLEGLIVPSKFYGVAADGKPVIVIAAKDGELARLVQDMPAASLLHRATPARSLAPWCDCQAIQGFSSKWVRGPEECCSRIFTRQKGFERWRQLLDALDDWGCPGRKPIRHARGNRLKNGRLIR
jgi:colanic acid biosynthesis glycosyl transferase WcaI